MGVASQVSSTVSLPNSVGGVIIAHEAVSRHVARHVEGRVCDPGAELVFRVVDR